jgi:hypothetical protein
MTRNSQGPAMAALFIAMLFAAGCTPGGTDGAPPVVFDRRIDTPVGANLTPTVAAGAASALAATPKTPNAAAVSGVASAQNPSAGTAGAGVPPPPASWNSGSAGASAPLPVPPTPTAAMPASKAIWKPKPGVSWQWQLTGTVDTSINAQMYDIDMFTISPAVVQKLHADNRAVICYFSAGTYEPDRPDSAQLAATGLGAVLDGWPDERWVDIRSPAVREIMRARLDLAVKQGCNGVEPDNVDAFDNENGLGLTAQDQLAFNSFLAMEAHARGLSIGLKNTLALIPQLVDLFDWALNEECEVYGECAALQPFIAAGKAVFHCEYTDGTTGDTVTDVDTNTSVIPGVPPGTGVIPSVPPGTGAFPSVPPATGLPPPPGGVPANGSTPGAGMSDDDMNDDGMNDDGMGDEGMGDEGESEGDEGDDGNDSESDAEYDNVYAFSQAQVCASKPAGFSTIIKHLDLDAYRLSCN